MHRLDRSETIIYETTDNYTSDSLLCYTIANSEACLHLNVHLSVNVRDSLVTVSRVTSLFFGLAWEPALATP